MGVDIEKLETLIVMGTSEAVAMAVEQGLGAGFISKMIYDKIVKDRVAIVEVRGLEIVQDIYFGRQTVRPSTGAQAAFWEFINRLDPAKTWKELEQGEKFELANMEKTFE